MLNSWLDPWRDLQRLRKLPRAARRLVVYSEGREYAVFFHPILSLLSDRYNFEHVVVTSDSADPLRQPHPLRRSYCVGFGAARTAFFQTLEADMVLLSTPDLHRFHVKRSRSVGHYAYLHHSVVSTHMAYRSGAFDHYDSILCVGPHHVSETRAWEARHGLRVKQLVAHGYAPIDALMAAENTHRARRSDRPTILVAPSWGQQGLIEHGAESVCRSLLRAGMRVILRPHPRTIQTRRTLVDTLASCFAAEANFILDLGIATRDTYVEADVMISDWSGAAFEFAFGLLRPVLFIDGPRKINNPDYGLVQSEPLEVSLRTGVGEIAPRAAVDAVAPLVERLLADAKAWRERIRDQRCSWIFNPGGSANAGAEFIARQLGLNARSSTARSLRERVREKLAPERGQLEIFLDGLIARPVSLWVDEDYQALHHLARKVAIGNGLYARYDGDWSRRLSASPLDRLASPALVLVFLMAAEAGGAHCKFLNAALRSLDLMAESGESLLFDALHEACAAALQRVGS